MGGKGRAGQKRRDKTPLSRKGPKELKPCEVTGMKYLPQKEGGKTKEDETQGCSYRK